MHHFTHFSVDNLPSNLNTKRESVSSWKLSKQNFKIFLTNLSIAPYSWGAREVCTCVNPRQIHPLQKICRQTDKQRICGQKKQRKKQRNSKRIMCTGHHQYYLGAMCWVVKISFSVWMWHSGRITPNNVEVCTSCHAGLGMPLNLHTQSTIH